MSFLHPYHSQPSPGEALPTQPDTAVSGETQEPGIMDRQELVIALDNVCMGAYWLLSTKPADNDGHLRTFYNEHGDIQHGDAGKMLQSGQYRDVLLVSDKKFGSDTDRVSLPRTLIDTILGTCTADQETAIQHAVSRRAYEQGVPETDDGKLDIIERDVVTELSDDYKTYISIYEGGLVLVTIQELFDVSLGTITRKIVSTEAARVEPDDVFVPSENGDQHTALYELAFTQLQEHVGDSLVHVTDDEYRPIYGQKENDPADISASTLPDGVMLGLYRTFGKGTQWPLQPLQSDEKVPVIDEPYPATKPLEQQHAGHNPIPTFEELAFGGLERANTLQPTVPNREYEQQLDDIKTIAVNTILGLLVGFDPTTFLLENKSKLKLVLTATEGTQEYRLSYDNFAGYGARITLNVHNEANRQNNTYSIWNRKNNPSVNMFIGEEIGAQQAPDILRIFQNVPFTLTEIAV